MPIDPLNYNREAWNQQVAQGNRWTPPVSSDLIDRAKRGEIHIVLTPQKRVPQKWLGDLSGRRVLMLASGGGQQSPIIAAAGAEVTVLDLSPAQLERDQEVARREGLSLRTVQGSMDDLSAFPDESFELIVHPCSNTFIPDVRPVWREAARVLCSGGELLAGFLNPLYWIFDDAKLKEGKLIVRHSIPYSDLTSLSETEQQELRDSWEPVCFGHSLEHLLAGQTDAGLHLIDLYEDTFGDGEYATLDRHIASFLATRSRKP